MTPKSDSTQAKIDPLNWGAWIVRLAMIWA